MFEKEAEEYAKDSFRTFVKGIREIAKIAFQKGAEFGYNKALEEVKHDLMMKLKDEGLVKPLKDSILRNERLSSQEQQELCAWIECAMDFGENLDECAKALEEATHNYNAIIADYDKRIAELAKANEWHYVKGGIFPKDEKDILCQINFETYEVGYYHQEKRCFYTIDGREIDVIAWKEIVLPKESK